MVACLNIRIKHYLFAIFLGIIFIIPVFSLSIYGFKHRPILGGIQIDIRKYYPVSGYLSIISYGPCSVGYKAKKWISGKLKYGYITSSHCINNTLGGSNWIWRIFQNIATTYNPLVNYAGSPEYYNINFDVAFIPYSDVIDFILSVDIYGDTKPLDIVGFITWEQLEYMFATGLLNSELIYKSGRTTGSTSGNILALARQLYGRWNYVIISNYLRAGGDSGGPTYFKYYEWVDGYYETYVKLVGLHFGGDDTSIGSVGYSVSVDKIAQYTGVEPIY